MGEQEVFDMNMHTNKTIRTALLITAAAVIIPTLFVLTSKAEDKKDDADFTPDPKLVEQGKTLFQTKICFTCHQTDPNTPAPAGEALHAPKFIGKFWGEDVKVHNGINGPIITVKFNKEYFMESVEQPMAKIVEGAIPGMAPLPTTPEERTALMHYVRSLSKKVEEKK
ncbi:MAG: c-type cytochrome [Phycisphaera sp.]|nr:c-type cytochrome [Phycisphaera sp.]